MGIVSRKGEIVKKENAAEFCRGAITKYLCKVAVQRKLCRRFALSGCFLLLSVLHTESAIEDNAIIIGNNDNSNSLVVNFNLLFSVTANLVGSVYHNFVNQVIEYFCGDSYVVTLPALGHVDENDDRVCDRCEEKFPGTQDDNKFGKTLAELFKAVTPF